MKTICYDLSQDLVTWDFVIWAVHARERGYEKINFQTRTIPPCGRKWLTPEEILHRVNNFMMPVAQALGMAHELGSSGDRSSGPSHFYDMQPDFRRLEIKAEYHGRHTITIREVQYKTYRNSNRDVWMAFADKIDAVIIDDYARKPIPFLDRFKLYAGAKMNWGVTNGPLSAVLLTPYPLSMMCDAKKDVKGFSGHGMVPGGQVPFALPNQRLVWGPITLENLLAAYEADGGIREVQ